MTKLYIGYGPAFYGAFDHFFLVNAPNGDLTTETGSHKLIEAVPSGQILGDPPVGNLIIFNNTDYEDSNSRLDKNNDGDLADAGDLQPSDRHLIGITLQANEDPDVVWSKMAAYLNTLGSPTFPFGPIDTSYQYFGLTNPNSNSVIVTALSAVGVNIANNVPPGTSLSFSHTPGSNFLLDGSGNTGDGLPYIGLQGFANNISHVFFKLGGADTFYGGSSFNKVDYSTADGFDAIRYGGTSIKVTQVIGSKLIVEASDNSFTDTLYSIERINHAVFNPENQFILDPLAPTRFAIEDLTPKEIEQAQAEFGDSIKSTIVSSVRVKDANGHAFIIDNFGAITGSGGNDQFSLNAVLGRHFDGAGGVNLLSYKNLTDTHGVKINADLGTVVIRGSDEVAGPGAPIVDVFENMTSIEGSMHGDIIYGSDGDDTLYGLGGDDIFVGGMGFDWFYGGYGRDTVDYGQEEAAGGTFDVRVMNVDDFSADVRVFDTYGYIDNMRDVETIVLTDGNDTVIYSHAVIPNVLTINGGDGDDSFTLSADTSFGYVQKFGDTWNFYDSYGGNDYKLTLLDFENVYFNYPEWTQLLLTVLPDLGQSSSNPINVFSSEGGGSYYAGIIDYTASDSGGAFHFGNGSQNNSAQVGGVTHIMQTPSIIYMPDHHNSITIDDESTLGTVYTGTDSDIVNLYTTQPVIYYSGGNDTYYMNAGFNLVRMAGNLTDDNIFNVQGGRFGETQSHITITMNVGVLNLYVPYLSYGNHYSIEVGQGYMDIVAGPDGAVTYQFVGNTDAPSVDFGTWSDDVIRGGGFSDYLTGSGGNDTLYGGNNADALYGGDGDDILYGDGGDDQLYGGFGNDTLSGGAGNDVLRGGWGDDVYVFSPGGGIEDIFDPDGYNSLKIKGGVPPENVTFVQSGNDLLINVASGVILRGYYAGTTSISEIIFENDDGEVTHSYTVQQMLNGEHLASNTAPVARDDAFTVNEDTVLSGNVLGDNGNGADSDPDGDTLIVTAGTFATLAGGSVVLAADGSFIYSPVVNFYGADSFTYSISDEQGGFASATVAIAVASVNDGPEAQDDTFSGTENQDIAGNLFADNGNGVDYDPDGGVLRLVQEIVVSAAGGSVALMHNGDFVYTPPAGFFGSDSFEYTLSDGQGGEATATAFIELAPANRAPEAQDDNDSGFILETIGGNVLIDNGNGADSDPDGDSLSIQPASFRTASGGLVVLEGDGDYTYTAVAGFTGTESFTYTLFDGQGGADTASVTLTVGLRGNEMRGSERGEFILGTQRSDVILAKGGDDFVLGRQSADKILGGAGKDFIHGQNGDDLLIGGSGSDQLYGGNGNDILIGDDVLMIGSGAGTRYMQAGSGGDGDCLDGGNGNDLLIGGVGNETLSGGNGADTFKFLSGANGKDRITDFDARDGDKIDISDVLESGYDPLADMISQFAKIDRQGHSYTLSVDADGADNGANFTAIAVFDSNRHLSLEAMIQNGSLIV